jgi:toxin-antitoxin system PIN domain toxin
VVIVDANVLLYAVDRASAHHGTSRSWLDRSLGGAEGVGFSWVALLAFIRIGTSGAIFPHPLPVSEAMAQVQRWLDAPAALVVAPTSGHARVLRGLLEESGTAGNLASDAHIAALAIEHRADVVSYDRDFARFEGVRHRLPAT